MAALEPVIARVVLDVSPADAFRAFTRDFGAWWPRAYTWSGNVLERIVIEAQPGGRCYEEGPHGFRCDWGRVRECEPPHGLTLLWQIAPTRAPEPDPARASRVRVSFSARPDADTEVLLQHDGFERHGEGGAAYREGMASPQGWPWMLEQYAEYVRNQFTPATEQR